jgi:hypothetical protein
MAASRWPEGKTVKFVFMKSMSVYGTDDVKNTKIEKLLQVQVLVCLATGP